MMEEVWKDVKGYEGRYQVSNLGRVRSLDMVLEGKNWKSPDPFEYQRNGKVLKPLKKRNGYYQVCLRHNGKPKYFIIHRLVALAFIPNPNKLPCVNHKDEDKANNVVSIRINTTVTMGQGMKDLENIPLTTSCVLLCNTTWKAKL